MHPSPANALGGELLRAEEEAGEQRRCLDGSVPGAVWAGPAPGGPGQAVWARSGQDIRCLASAHLH